MGSRSSTRHGPASVFQGRVRRWRKSWAPVLPPLSPSAAASRMLFYKWTPVTFPTTNGRCLHFQFDFFFNHYAFLCQTCPGQVRSLMDTIEGTSGHVKDLKLFCGCNHAPREAKNPLDCWLFSGHMCRILGLLRVINLPLPDATPI